MSRPLRIEYPDAWSHIMNRGGRIKENNRQELFRDLTPLPAWMDLVWSGLRRRQCGQSRYKTVGQVRKKTSGQVMVAQVVGKEQNLDSAMRYDSIV